MLAKGVGEQPFYSFVINCGIFILCMKRGVKVHLYCGLFGFLIQFELEYASRSIREIANALHLMLRLPEACQGGGC